MSYATTGNASLFLPLPEEDDPYDGLCEDPTREARAADTAGPLTHHEMEA